MSGTLFRPLGPVLVGAGWRCLLGAQAGAVDSGMNEVLGRDRGVGQPPEHGQLAHVSHRVGERPLQQLLRRELRELGCFQLGAAL